MGSYGDHKGTQSRMPTFAWTLGGNGALVPAEAPCARPSSGFDQGEGQVHAAPTHLTKGCHWSLEGHYQPQGADITMEDFSVFLDMRRCQKWAHKISSNYLKACSSSFPRAQRASRLVSTLSSTQAVLRVCSFSGSCFTPCRGWWQVPDFSSHLEHNK